MATSTVRALILAGLVVLGVVGLTKVFPANSSAGIVTTSPTTTKASPKPSPSTSPTRQRKGKIKGVVVLVLNATDRSGIAADLGAVLKDAGYNVLSTQNAPTTRADTVVYYRADSQPEAKRLANKYTPNAKVLPAPAGVPANVRVEVVLGADYQAVSPASGG